MVRKIPEAQYHDQKNPRGGSTKIKTNPREAVP